MNKKIFYAAVATAGVIVLAFVLWPRLAETEANKTEATAAEESAPARNRLKVSPETLKAAGIETVEVAEQEPNSTITVTGAVEANQQKMQEVTPLVSGRVERVNVVLGDRVSQGDVLAVILSPEVAEMHGKLHEAETRLVLGQENLQRVQRAENRSAVLQAKARLDETEASLRRTRRLIELGAAAGKDLTAAETGFTSAKAEYDYQSNISLNREVQAARSEVETAQVEVAHLRNSLSAMGASLPEGDSGQALHDTSTVALRASVPGRVIARMVNPGAGIERGKPLFTIADISTLWVIANVPEGQIGSLRVGTPSAVNSPELGVNSVAGRIAYIDPVLNEETRTGRVRVEIDNPGERLKVGMFVGVNFVSSPELSNGSPPRNAVVADASVQRIGERTVVFVPVTGTSGEFEIRDVQLGDFSNGFHAVITGIEAGEHVVTKGSFILKTQLMKGELGEE